jgi:hypothetical protein
MQMIANISIEEMDLLRTLPLRQIDAAISHLRCIESGKHEAGGLLDVILRLLRARIGPIRDKIKLDDVYEEFFNLTSKNLSVNRWVVEAVVLA